MGGGMLAIGFSFARGAGISSRRTVGDGLAQAARAKLSNSTTRMTAPHRPLKARRTQISCHLCNDRESTRSGGIQRT